MYTYRCEKCGKEFETEEYLEIDDEHPVHLATMTDNGEKRCNGKLYRVYKPPMIIIRGVK